MNTKTIVVSVTAVGALACASPTPTPPPVTDGSYRGVNPPPPPRPPVSTTVQLEGTLPDVVLPDGRVTDHNRFTMNLNPKDSEGRFITRSHDSCYVYLPFPEPPTSVVPPPTLEVPCPPEMASFLWSQCYAGDIRAAPDRDLCICDVMGNPPPPTQYVHCPPQLQTRR